MSYKHWFPTYRARYLFVQDALASLGRVPRALDLGCGEGDADRLIAAHADELVSCDLNADDVAHARQVNRDLRHVTYAVEDAQTTTFDSASFDLVVCLEVIEHVGAPAHLVREIGRVLRPGGTCILTCPSERFPLSYDPINFALAGRGTHLPIGAYAYGHEWLVREERLREWLGDASLRVLREERLTGALAAYAELYWAGLAHRLLKPNAKNSERAGQHGLRPSSNREPAGVGVVDALIATDGALLRRTGSHRSVGLAYVVERA